MWRILARFERAIGYRCNSDQQQITAALRNGVAIALVFLLTGCATENQKPEQEAASSYRPKVFFAGLSFVGRYDYMKDNYPFTLRLNQLRPSGRPMLEQDLSDRLQGLQPKHYSLEYGLADASKGETIIAAVAVDGENISREQLVIGRKPVTKVIVELSLQLLYFDFESKTLLRSVPVVFALNHVVPEGSDIDSEILKYTAKAYLGEDKTSGLLAKAVDRLMQEDLTVKKPLRFQVVESHIDDAVEIPGADILARKRLENYIGQYFSTALSSRSSASVLPFIRDYAIGNQMTARFSNGDSYEIKLPAPDYELSVDLKGLRREESSGTFLYISTLRAALKESMSRRALVEGDFRYAVGKSEVPGQISYDDSSAYQDSVEALLDDLAGQFVHADRDWQAKHARQPDSYEKFKTSERLFH